MRLMRIKKLWSVFLFVFCISLGEANAAIASEEEGTSNSLGAIHYYSFDEENTLDYFENGADGTPVGNIGFADGKFGKALKLDGSSYVKLPTDILPTPESFTISMWVYNQTEDNALARLLSTGVFGEDTPGVTLGIHTNVNAAGSWADITYGVGREGMEGYFDFSWAVDYNVVHENWCHVVLVCDAAESLIMVYMDGEEKDRITYAGCNIESRMEECALGGHLKDGELYEAFTGLLDDVAIFDRALTPMEVVQVGSGKLLNTVKFESNGGSPVAPMAVFAGGKAAEPECVRTAEEGEEEWKLVAWSTHPEAYEPYNFKKTVTKNMTLYAMWRQGEYVNISFVGYDDLTQKIAAGEKAVEPENPVKEGYELDSWYWDEAMTRKFDFDEEVYVDAKLYPKWVKADTEADITDTEKDTADIDGENFGNNLVVWVVVAVVVIALAVVVVSKLRKKESAK